MSDSDRPDDFLKTGGALDGGLARSAFDCVDGALAPGYMVGRVRILERIGTGGMGDVYRGVDEGLDRMVALKTLRADLSRVQKMRLLQEAKILSRLDHPGINRLFDLVENDRQPFLLLEYVAGTPLDELAGTLDEGVVVDIAVQIAEALAAAHRQGVVHRDLKPANVMMTDEGNIKILDFGIGRLVEEAQFAQSVERTLKKGIALETPHTGFSGEEYRTSLGAIVGTPWFMSPEQARGEPVTPASDLFSFGLTVCALVTGRSPITGEVALEAIVEAAEGSLEIPDDLSPPLRRLIVDLTRIEIDARPTADEAAQRLRDILNAPVRRRRRWLFGTGAVAALAAVVFALGLGTRLGEGRYRCRDFASRLNGIWDAARRDGLAAGFARVGAQGAFEVVRPVLDAYADEWVQVRTEGCESTWVHGEQSTTMLDLQFACLDRRLQELGSLVDVLEEDAQAVRNKAAQAAHALTPVSVCLDAQLLLDEVPLPDDAVRRQRIDDQRRNLARIKALYDTGSYETGFAEIEALREPALAADYAPLAAEFSYLRGLLAEKRGDMDLAGSALHEAVLYGMEGRDDRRVAEAWIRTVWLEGPLLSDFDAARTSARFAAAAINRLGSDPLLEGALANHLSIIADVTGDDEGALELCLEALDLRREAFGYQHPKVASTMMNCGLDLMDLGRYDEALHMTEQAFQMQLVTLGPDHPAVYVTMNGLASTLRELGRNAEAASLEERTIELVEKNFPPDHPQLGLLKSNLANQALRDGRPEEARVLAGEGVAILSQNLGEMTVPNADALYNLARANDDLADWDQAVRAGQRAAAIYDSLYGRGHEETIRAQAVVGKGLGAQGETDRALEVLEAAMTAAETAGFDEYLREFVRLQLAEVLIVSGREPDRGRSLLEVIAARTAGSDDARMAQLRDAAAGRLDHR